jgi:CHAT domain-containing protein
MKTTQEIIKEIDKRIKKHEDKTNDFKQDLDLENALKHSRIALELLFIKDFIMKKPEEIIKEIDRRIKEHEDKTNDFKQDLDLENAIKHILLSLELMKLKEYILQ